VSAMNGTVVTATHSVHGYCACRTEKAPGVFLHPIVVPPVTMRPAPQTSIEHVTKGVAPKRPSPRDPRPAPSRFVAALRAAAGRASACGVRVVCEV
jgi:hypothetical protein